MNALQSSYQKAELAHEATTVYAQDMPDVSELMSALTPLLREGDGLHWAVLMDTAFDDGVVALPQAEGVLNCFAGAGRLDDLARIALCLVPLRPGALGEGVLRAMANHAGARPMFSVLASRIELPVLAMRWRSLHLLSVGDDPMPLLLRWADTRTLAVLPGVLTPPQWSAIAGPLVHWIFLNREGVAQACPQAAAAPDAESTDIGPLILSDDQVQRLIDEAEADALHSNLVSQLIASGAALPRPSAIYRLTRAALDKADKAGISNMKDRTSLALAACVTAGGALGSSRLEALLQSREWPSGDLFNALLRARVIAINAVPGSESADMH